jgi:hypothetical protein
MKLVEKLVLGPSCKIGGKTSFGSQLFRFVEFSIIFIPNYVFDGLLFRNWLSSPPHRLTLQKTLISAIILGITVLWRLWTLKLLVSWINKNSPSCGWHIYNEIVNYTNYLKTHEIGNTKIIHAFKQFEILHINTIIEEKREREKANAFIIGIQGSHRFEFRFIEDKRHMVIIRSIWGVYSWIWCGRVGHGIYIFWR